MAEVSMVLKIWSDRKLTNRLPANEVVALVKPHVKPWMVATVEHYRGRPECVVTVRDEEDPADALCTELRRTGFDITTDDDQDRLQVDMSPYGPFVLYHTDTHAFGSFQEWRARSLATGSSLPVAMKLAIMVSGYEHAYGSHCKLSCVDWLKANRGMDEEEAVRVTEAVLPGFVGVPLRPELKLREPSAEAKAEFCRLMLELRALTPEQRANLSMRKRLLCMLSGLQVAESPDDTDYSELFEGDVD
jgi:hypothetical protein